MLKNEANIVNLNGLITPKLFFQTLKPPAIEVESEIETSGFC